MAVPGAATGIGVFGCVLTVSRKKCVQFLSLTYCMKEGEHRFYKRQWWITS